MPGSNGNGLRPEEEHVLGMSNTEDVSSVNDGKKSITAWLGLASAIGGGALNFFMNERNNRYNREQNEQAYQQNLQMWNLQNAYNLPANQIARLKQAGLNPNLIYGNPDNTAGAPPEKQGAKGERGELDPMAIANALLMQKQMEQSDSQIKLNEASAYDLEQTARGKELDNEKKDFDNSKLRERYDREVRKFEQDYQYVYNEMLLIAQRVFTERKKGKLLDSQIDAQELENAFTRAVESERIQQFITQGKISKQQLANLQKEWKKLCVQIDNLTKEGKILDQKRLFDELNNIVFASQNWASLRNSPVTYYTDKETGDLKIVARGMTNLDTNEGAYVVLEFLKEVVSVLRSGGGLKYTNISGNSKTTTTNNNSNNRSY